MFVFFSKFFVLDYCLMMKILIIFLVLAISTQPLQAGFCDMESNQETAHHMQQPDNAGDTTQDCCDSEQPHSQQSCDQQMNCGFCSAVTSAKSDLQNVAIIWSTRYAQDMASGEMEPSNAHPPFRPPIS